MEPTRIFCMIETSGSQTYYIRERPLGLDPTRVLCIIETSGSQTYYIRERGPDVWILPGSSSNFFLCFVRFPNSASRVPFDSIQRSSPHAKKTRETSRKQAPGEISPQRTSIREVNVSIEMYQKKGVIPRRSLSLECKM